MLTDPPRLSWGSGPGANFDPDEGAKVKKFVFPGLPLIIYS